MEIKQVGAQVSEKRQAEWLTGTVRGLAPPGTHTHSLKIALADRARFVLSCYVVVEILSLRWRRDQRLVHRRRYIEIAGDRPALKLYLKHMSDCVVCDR